MIKRFRKKYSKSGVAKEVRDRMFFEKPSDKKRRKKVQSIRMIKREEEKVVKQPKPTAAPSADEEEDYFGRQLERIP